MLKKFMQIPIKLCSVKFASKFSFSNQIKAFIKFANQVNGSHAQFQSSFGAAVTTGLPSKFSFKVSAPSTSKITTLTLARS